MPEVDDANSSGAASNKVAVFRAAVKGLRSCLELLHAIPAHVDLLCYGFLKIVENPDPEGSLEEFRKHAERLANGDMYMTAILQALDGARSEADAERCVMSSVIEQLTRRKGAL